MKKLIIALLGLTIGGAATAQQTPLSNFYNFNEYLLNPAEAGFKDKLAGTASHRVQWQGIEGAPKTTFVGIHGMMNDNMGLGGKISVDQTDILKQFNAALSYSYRIMLNEKAKLNFGVSAMMVQNSVGYADAVVGNLADEVVNGGTENGMAFDAEAGIMLEYGKLKLGIASSHLFESGVGYNLPNNGGDGTFERVRQFSAYGSYEFELSESWDLEPFVLVRNQGPESFQVEVNALTTWNETLYLGAGYRQEAGFIGRVGIQITDQLIAAYAYEFSGSGIASYSSGSHEFMLGYRIKNKKKKEVKRELSPELTSETTEPMVAGSKPIIEKEKEEVEPIQEEVKKVENIQTQKKLPSLNEAVVEKVEEQDAVKEKVEMEEMTATTSNDTSKSSLSPQEKEILDTKVRFEFEESSLNDETKANLDKMAKVLKDNPNAKVIIEGHTCNMGTDAVNTLYSIKRANKVKDYFLLKQVNPSQIETKAMRDTQPLVPNSSITNRQKNRRVELELVK